MLEHRDRALGVLDGGDVEVGRVEAQALQDAVARDDVGADRLVVQDPADDVEHVAAEEPQGRGVARPFQHVLRHGHRVAEPGVDVGHVPRSPRATASRKATIGGLARLWKSTIKVTPASFAAATIASASSTVVASGFSTRMCLPASAQATATARWAWSGVATETAAISGSSRMSSSRVVCRRAP